MTWELIAKALREPRHWKQSGWARVAATNKKDLLARRDNLLASAEVTRGLEGGQETELGGDPIVTLPSGHRIVHLKTQFDKDYEGELNDNCVGTHGEDNVYSLRDPDNLPRLSFAMSMKNRGRQCDTCHGNGGRHVGDENNDDRWQNCADCQGLGYHDENTYTDNYHLSSLYGKGNTSPKAEDLKTLLKGITQHSEETRASGATGYNGEPDILNKLSLDNGQPTSLTHLNEKMKQLDNPDERLPKGEVFLKFKQHHIDQLNNEGKIDVGDSAYMGGWGSRIEWSEHDPGPSTTHHVYKTPFSKKRFGVEEGADNVLRGGELAERPEIWTKDNATFPKNVLHEVHKPHRPTRFYVSTQTELRDNPAYFQEGGMNGKAMTQAIHEDHAAPETRGEAVPLQMRRTNTDVWEVNLTPEEAEKHLEVVNDSGANHGALKIKNDSIIPWDKMKLRQTSDREDAPEFPTFKDGKPQIKEPTHVYANIQLHGGTPWHVAEGFKHSGFNTNDLKTGDMLLTSPTGRLTGVSDQSNPAQIKIPNDPRYVEELKDKQCDTCKGEGLVPGDDVHAVGTVTNDKAMCGDCRGHGEIKERNTGTFWARRQFRLKPNTFIPREAYEYEGNAREEAPSKMYLHVPMQFRDRDEAYSDEGINVKALETKGSSERKNWKITDKPNEEIHNQPYSDENKTTYHPFGPKQADIYELDASKLPGWSLQGDYRRDEYGEHKSGHQDYDDPDKHVTRLGVPKGKERSEACGPECKKLKDEYGPAAVVHANEVNGEDVPINGSHKGPVGAGTHTWTEAAPEPIIPWEAITKVHSKAGQISEQLQKRKLIASKLQSEGWGEVRVAKLGAQ